MTGIESQAISKSISEQSEQLKSTWIQLRCTHEEKELIRRRASEDGRTMTNWLLWLAKR